jgi:hypothetical protein
MEEQIIFQKKKYLWSCLTIQNVITLIPEQQEFLNQILHGYSSIQLSAEQLQKPVTQTTSLRFRLTT